MHKTKAVLAALESYGATALILPLYVPGPPRRSPAPLRIATGFTCSLLGLASAPELPYSLGRTPKLR